MMRNLFRIALAIVIISLFGCQPVNDQAYRVTFQVDMSGVEVGEQDTVGVRGSVAPLSWTETYPMIGPDENGVYKVTIPFEDIEHGTRVQYKYFYGDDNWDNNRYAENGNRVVTVCCLSQVHPVDKWDELDEFAYEVLLESAESDILMFKIFIIAKGKERGLSLDEIAEEDIDFWDWPDNVAESPEFFLIRDEFYQARHPFGHFELIQNTPDKVEYIINNNLEIVINMWNEEGDVNGVTPDEIKQVEKKIMEYYVNKAGWTLEWKDEPDNKIRITITK